ncbi:HlyC/CorC family transporter [Candidatus Saganbacteria bacterium]|nr:HlyC/CorC family transporter [Candidatus Saganbacteria bacterium]
MATGLILLAILIALSAFFSLSETAIVSLSRLRVNRLIEQKVRGAKILSEIKAKPAEMLSTILIGNNVANITASALATALVIQFCEQHGWQRIGLAVGIATGIMTLLILAFGEIIPKTIALHRAEKVSLSVAPVILVLEIIIRPVAYTIGFFIRPFIYLFGGQAPEHGPFITEEEIRLILAAGEKEGVIEEEERQMITSIFEFGDTIAREVMTPRPDIAAISSDNNLDEAKNLIIESGHSRLPIYESNLDNIIGVIYAKDVLKSAPETSLKDIMRPAIFVPETKKVSELLHEMQVARTHMAVIVDEYGVSAGLVTMEDLIEEIIGEIHDEFEREEKMIEKIEPNIFIVDGRMSLSDVNERLQIALPVEEQAVDTLGGFVFAQLGKAPSVGQNIRLEKLLLSVERIHRRRITRVRIVKLEHTASEEGVGG